MDFLDSPVASAGNIGQLKTSQQKNSSSDEGGEQNKSEFLTSKRKHPISVRQSPSKEANKQFHE
ncbi:hypothetical protein CEXT_504441, partial [Caerostris extrusa]